MPSVSSKQARFMRAELAKKRAGKPTKTGMSLGKLVHWVKADKGQGNG